jgi:hypothetical protein
MANNNPYRVGDVARIRATFRNSQNSTLIDPDTVEFHYRVDLGTPTVLSYPTDITRISQGVYETLVLLSLAGSFQYYYHSTGNGAATSDPAAFNVIALPF